MTNQPDRFRRLPLEVEARQVVGSDDGQTGRDLAAWCYGWVSGTYAEPKIGVPTLEGDLVARTGDWIVRGTRGEFWPVRGDIFAETYEPVRPAPSMSVEEAEARLAPLEDAVRADRHARQAAAGPPAPQTPLLAAAFTLELDRDASAGESAEYRRGMTRAVQVLRLLNEDEPPVAGAGQAADQTTLRDRIAAALIAWTYRGQEPDPETGILDTVRANAYSRTDAVLAVLPAPTDTAAVLTPAERTMLTYALDQAQEAIWSEDGFTEEDQAAVDSLRRLADEQPAPTTPDEDPARIDRLRPEFTEHSSVEAIDAQLQRARTQERRWHIRTEWLTSLRAARVEQQARADEPAGPAAPAKETPAAALLATPCDVCSHTLNWHRNDVGCTVSRCVCSRFRQPETS